MNLSEIIKIQETLLADYERLKLTGRTQVTGAGDLHFEIGQRQVKMAQEGKPDHFLMQAFIELSTLRLGPPGGPAHSEGGSFDWDIQMTPQQTLYFAIKSWTSDDELARLRQTYARFGMMDAHDFR